MRRHSLPPLTLADLRNSSSWLWINCVSCGHYRPIALVPFIIRYGPNASSDVLRHRARCSACGAKGATLQHPSWVDSETRFMPFPGDRSTSAGNDQQP